MTIGPDSSMPVGDFGESAGDVSVKVLLMLPSGVSMVNEGETGENEPSSEGSFSSCTTAGDDAAIRVRAGRLGDWA